MPYLLGVCKAKKTCQLNFISEMKCLSGIFRRFKNNNSPNGELFLLAEIRQISTFAESL